MKKRHVILTVLILLAVCILTAGYAYKNQNNASQTSSSAAGTIDSAAPKGEQHVVILLSGWDWKITQNSGITYTPSMDVSNTQSLNLISVNENDVRYLANTLPLYLSNTWARMINADPLVKCDKNTCSSASFKSNLNIFTDSKKVPNLAQTYIGYQIPSLLYKADIYVPDNETTLTLKTINGVPYTLNIYNPATLGKNITRSALNGYGKDTYLLGSSFGRFFKLDPYWQVPNADLSRKYTNTTPDAASSDTSSLVKNKVNTAPLFSNGLAAPVAAAVGLGDQQLTYMTSPTTGCNPGVLCVPLQTNSNISNQKAGVLQAVCSVKDSSKKAIMVSESSYWTYNYAVPTPQYGAWNGTSLQSFAGYNATISGYFHGGKLPLVKGKQTLWMQNLYFYTGAVPTLWDVVGNVAQKGYDKPNDFDKVWQTSDISQVENGYFKTC